MLASCQLLGTYFSEVWDCILSFSFKKMQLKMSVKMAAILSRCGGVWAGSNTCQGRVALQRHNWIGSIGNLQFDHFWGYYPCPLKSLQPIQISIFGDIIYRHLGDNDYHYSDVIMGAMASKITSLTIVYSTVYWGADHRKHQSSASLAFVWGIHRWLVNSPHKGPVTRNMFPFDDVIMT